MEFIVGCNYWASNAGTNMWKDFDIDVIENDIRILREHGMKYMRVFPSWDDFQPIVARYVTPEERLRYSIESDELNENKFFLEKKMMDRFSAFLDVCEKYDVKIIVGLITGFMSGGMLVPQVLAGENPVTSPVSQYMQQLFIKGFVGEFKDREIIFAWDLGNECNAFYHGKDKYAPATWLAMTANAIRAEDPSRPVISGMSMNVVDGNWSIGDQALFCDMTTTHPYPFWNEPAKIDETLEFRTTMHPTCFTKFCADIGNKPCLCEETGTMGPMVCSDELSGDFARLNAFSLWANGSLGMMWWCGHDQTELEHYPYSDIMVEHELGLLRNDYTPKPALLEMDKFGKWLDTIDFELPKAKDDAVCILTRNQNHYGIGYMTYVLAKKAGLNCRFAYSEDGIPESDIYILPSLLAFRVMNKKRYQQLLERVENGADLYISVHNSILSEFEKISGVKVIDSYVFNEKHTAEVLGEQVEFTTRRNYLVEPTTAEVLAYDDRNNPFITVNKYGKGRIFFVNGPVEANLVDMHHAFDGNNHLVYKKVFADYIENQPVKLSNEDLVYTYHPTEDGAYIVVLNHFAEDKEFTLELKDLSVEKVYYGENGKIKAYDACVIKLSKK